MSPRQAAPVARVTTSPHVEAPHFRLLVLELLYKRTAYEKHGHNFLDLDDIKRILLASKLKVRTCTKK
jgi:hypothetical protein